MFPVVVLSQHAWGLDALLRESLPGEALLLGWSCPTPQPSKPHHQGTAVRSGGTCFQLVLCPAEPPESLLSKHLLLAPLCVTGVTLLL